MRGGCGSKIWVSPQNIFTPHRFACGLTPLAHRLPLKGGVVFPLSSVADDHQGGSNRGKPHIPLPRNPVFHRIPLSFRIIVFIRHCFGKDTLGNMSPPVRLRTCALSSPTIPHSSIGIDPQGGSIFERPCEYGLTYPLPFDKPPPCSAIPSLRRSEPLPPCPALSAGG